MNKFARLDLGLKALLGRKTTVTAETSVQLSQLDWDNFSFSEEEQAIWEEMVNDAAQEQFCCEGCGKKGLFYWCYCPECEESPSECPCGDEGCRHCNPHDLDNSEWDVPLICKGCGHEEKKYGMGDFCGACEANGTKGTILGKEKVVTFSDVIDVNCKGGNLSDVVDAWCKRPYSDGIPF